jgi:hypothetical protein
MARITVKEFFSLREMFMGLDEDFELALENYKNLDFDDKEILDLLFTKSMLFEKRVRFILAIHKTYTSEQLIGKNINAVVKSTGDYVVYKKILLKILYPEK